MRRVSVKHFLGQTRGRDQPAALCCVASHQHSAVHRQTLLVLIPGRGSVCFASIALCVVLYCQKFLVLESGGGHGWLAVRG